MLSRLSRRACARGSLCTQTPTHSRQLLPGHTANVSACGWRKRSPYTSGDHGSALQHRSIWGRVCPRIAPDLSKTQPDREDFEKRGAGANTDGASVNSADAGAATSTQTAAGATDGPHGSGQHSPPEAPHGTDGWPVQRGLSDASTAPEAFCGTDGGSGQLGASDAFTAPSGEATEGLRNAQFGVGGSPDVGQGSGELAQQVAQVAADWAPLSLWWPPNIGVRAMEMVHYHGGVSWAVGLMAVTLATRILLAPLVVRAQQEVGKMMVKLDPEGEIKRKALLERSNALTKQMWTRNFWTLSVEEQTAITNELHDLQQKLKQFSGQGSQMMVFGMPISVGLTFLFMRAAIRKMSLYHPDWAQGGIWFVKDLSVGDPFVLPAIAAGCYFLTSRLNLRTPERAPEGKAGDMMKQVVQYKSFLCAGIFYGLSFYPADLQLFFVTSNSCTLLLTATLAQQPVRDFFKLPPLYTQEEHDSMHREKERELKKLQKNPPPKPARAAPEWRPARPSPRDAEPPPPPGHSTATEAKRHPKKTPKKKKKR